MTLSQTYISRKQLLVDNLVAKGVTGYTVNDGLTTLINAVLEIQRGGVRTLTLTADKSILSYYDEDTATLTATLLEGGEPVANEYVEFFTGSTSLGTAVTDSNGVATKTYTSQGIGDITLSAKVGSISSETYEVEDCMEYQPMTSNAHQSRWDIPSAVTSASIFGYSSDGWKFGNASSYSRIKHNTSLTSPFCAEFTVTAFGTSSSNPSLATYFYSGGTSTPNVGFVVYSNRIDYNGTTVVNHGGVNGAVYRIEFSASNIKLYENDVLLYTGNHSVSLPTQFEFHTGSSRYCVVKDFKLKPL